MTPEEMQDLFGDDDPFSDFFHTFFGGRVGRRRRATRPAGRRGPPGPRSRIAVDLTLEEAFTGTTRRLMMTRDGKERTVDVRIPAGVKDGARVRAAGEGARARPAARRATCTSSSASGRTPGSSAAVRTSTRKRRRSRRRPRCSAARSACRRSPGRRCDSKVPELTPNGRVFRLRGHGMPSVGKADERGDLYATVEVQMPFEAHGPEERQHYEALRETAARDGQCMNLNKYTEKAQEAVLAAQQPPIAPAIRKSSPSICCSR